jgi:hypothetical protein
VNVVACTWLVLVLVVSLRSARVVQAVSSVEPSIRHW